jgi:putative ABC transport system substrate-binding protein
MKRRIFIAFLGGASVAWSLTGRGQQRAIPVIGYLSGGSPGPFARFVDAFRLGMSEQGYVDGRNVAVEYRWAEGQPDRLPELAADLVRRRVAVIVATGASPSALAAKAKTSTIAIVFTGGGDPVKLGLVASLGRPGGNATGIVSISAALNVKRLELLRDLVPTAPSIGVLFNPTYLDSDAQLNDIREAARVIGRPVHIVGASSEKEFAHAFATLVQMRAGALFVVPDPLFTSAREQLVALAAKHAIPASYAFRDFVEAGGLMSYGANLADVHRQAGVYAGRILNGAKPADLPVSEPTKFDLVINSTTAKALGITIPPKLLVIAEVIE